MKTFDGYKKRNLTDKDYALLAGGGHKALDTLFSALSSDTTNAIKITVGGTLKSIPTSTLKTSLGLGSNAYTSTAYLPLAGGTMTGDITMNGMETNINWNVDYLGGWARSFIVYNQHNSSSGNLVRVFHLGGYGNTNGFEYAYIGTADYDGNNLRFNKNGTITIGSGTIWHSNNDGTGSGLDADLLDGIHANGLFTAFSNAGNLTTRITIGGVTKDLKIDANTVDNYHIGVIPYINDYGTYTGSGTWYLKINTIDWAGSENIVYINTHGNNCYGDIIIHLGSRGGSMWGFSNSYNSHGISGIAKSVGAPIILYLKITHPDCSIRTNFLATITKADYSSITYTDIGVGFFTLYGNGTIANADTVDGKHANDFAISGHNHYRIKLSDDRAKYPGQLAGNETSSIFGGFMQNSTLGISNFGYYSDVLVIRSYVDSSGGNDNAIIFNKDTRGVWHTQFGFGSTTSWGTPYLFLDSNNFNKYTPTLTGTGASGTWDINITGNAATATNSTNIYIEAASGDVNYAMLFTTATANGNGRIYADSQWRTAGITFNPAANTLNVGNRIISPLANHTQTSIRHLDAGLNSVNTDHSLYIGYGAQTYTASTRFYYSTGTTDSTSSRTEFMQINSNGAYALTRFGINGLNTSYTLYAYGTNHMFKNNGCVNLYLKADTDVVELYSIIRFGVNNNNNAGYIFQNGPSRTIDGGANTMTIRNNVGVLRLQNRVHIDSTGRIYPEGTSSRRTGIYGSYDSTKIGHIWSIGTSYMIPDDGTNFGNLYGLAYKHTNNTTGGTMAGGHQVVWCDNGNPRAAMGYNGFWTIGGYYKNGSSDSYILLGGGGHKAITDFAMASHDHNRIKGPDARSSNNNPLWYMTNRGSGSVTSEFSSQGTSVLGRTYTNLTTFTPWGDSSGDYPVLLAFNLTGMAMRTAASTNAWNSWPSGNIYAGNFYTASDIRYKKILSHIKVSIKQLAKIPLFNFTWTDVNDNIIHSGTSALKVKKFLPHIVTGSNKLTLDYATLGTIAGITACKELVNLKSEIEQLRERVAELEQKLNDYGIL